MYRIQRCVINNPGRTKKIDGILISWFFHRASFSADFRTFTHFSLVVFFSVKGRRRVVVFIMKFSGPESELCSIRAHNERSGEKSVSCPFYIMQHKNIEKIYVDGGYTAAENFLLSKFSFSFSRGSKCRSQPSQLGVKKVWMRRKRSSIIRAYAIQRNPDCLGSYYAVYFTHTIPVAGSCWSFSLVYMWLVIFSIFFLLFTPDETTHGIEGTVVLKVWVVSENQQFFVSNIGRKFFLQNKYGDWDDLFSDLIWKIFVRIIYEF